MLVGLKGEMQHLSGLVALLRDELVADSKEAGEAGLDDPVKVLTVLAVDALVPKSTAEGQEALETGKDGCRVVDVEELQGEVDEAGPAGREVVLQDTL